MPEQESSGLGDNTLKVLTFAGPLLASSLAITYDVGFFVGVGIGFFSFFSLSEHLVFALQSLPFAIPPVAVLLLWFTTGWYGYRLGRRDGTVSTEGIEAKLSNLHSAIKTFVRPRLWLPRLWMGMLIPCIFINAWRGQYAVAFLIGCLPIYLAKAPDVHAAWKSRSPVLMAICAFAALILSFLIGLQRADAVLNSQSASEMIGIEDKSLPARLIRGGDKGVLFFSLETRKVRFLRWDSIKQIETL
jgi:hypothetical protein